ncbi:MAG: ROK family transcriptional regulator [Pseudomonadota bacterium]
MAEIEPEAVETAQKFETTGSNQSGMRAHNERLVLSILRREGALPKADIARRTGLSAQAVSVIMRALEADGLLEKGEKVRGKIGQPSVPIRLAPNGAYFLGLKVGRRSAELVLVNFVGEELAHLAETYDYPTPARTLDFARRALAEVRGAISPSDRARIAGMGIAMPFFLWEWAAIIGVEDAKMAAWRECDLRSEIAALVDMPVWLGNDATCACGAELVFGKAETPSDFLYIYIGYFVGGGIVLNGALYTGSSGNAGAIGPYPVRNADGQQSQLVDVASLIGLERRLKAAGLDSSAIWDRPATWAFDPSLIEDWLSEAVPALSHMILGAQSVVDFSAVLIDGHMPEAMRDRVVARVKDALGAQNLSGLSMPEIAPGTVGSRARPLGAASLALSKRFMV